MAVVPLPTPLLDILLVVNVSVSMWMLLIAMYIPNALKPPAFPTIMLVPTLFRLALNARSTRLILVDARGGEVIHSCGQFIVRGNFVVGVVIFLGTCS